VTRFAPGDEVFGRGRGALAEHAVASETRIARKPSVLSFESAASIPCAGVTALQALRDGARLEAGQSILINGASGGVGTFAVQIAAALGAEVTAVCSTANAELVRSLGAADVVDYTRHDFARAGQRYDVVLDLVGNRSLRALRRALTPRGTLVSAGGARGRWFRPLAMFVKVSLAAPLARQPLRTVMADVTGADLDQLAQLADAGQLQPRIDRTYPLRETQAALAYLEEGHARGKVVVTVGALDGTP
jgi:NADPH:quinone reductase-like Zn-dependent oxidoreductase